MNIISLFLMSLACMRLGAAQITLKMQPDPAATQKPSAATTEVTKKPQATQTNLSIKNNKPVASRQHTIQPSSPSFCSLCCLSFWDLCSSRPYGNSY